MSNNTNTPPNDQNPSNQTRNPATSRKRITFEIDTEKLDPSSKAKIDELREQLLKMVKESNFSRSLTPSDMLASHSSHKDNDGWI